VWKRQDDVVCGFSLGVGRPLGEGLGAQLPDEEGLPGVDESGRGRGVLLADEVTGVLVLGAVGGGWELDSGAFCDELVNELLVVFEEEVAHVFETADGG
jgi:hypothetical protein